ncbi:lactonase family protein [Marinitenerispora sediminis]|uniref:lactonase family protein n=1 Tax=Marinitenerispora sediminis TaxID=1931232 RepID=UPI000DF3E5F4|nr:lactonase family protein [Marinitenerispora sediminis]RCV47950.1 lactonase family protein [Marinitenerispora sediminis]RCV52021.1 lactonase family protein [Marinitenerispora sediminis]
MNGRLLLWTGGYGADEAGTADIRRVWLDPATGGLADGGAAARTANPSFLAAHPRGDLLYAVNERDGAGAVTGFSVGPGATLTETGSVPTGGGAPCHLFAHPAGQRLVVANYQDGSVSVHPLTATGAPGPHELLLPGSGHGPDPERQEGPHAHSVTPAPGGRHLLVADLGTDQLRRYPADPGTGAVEGSGGSAARLPGGTGPRHVAVHPGGHLYAAGELDARVHVLRWDPASATARHVAAVAATEATSTRAYPSEIVLAPGGRRLYVANRGPDTVTVFAVEEDGAVLRRLAEVPTAGTWPRHMALVAGHLVVANQRSDELTVLRIDAGSGIPHPTAHRLSTPRPACVLPAVG